MSTITRIVKEFGGLPDINNVWMVYKTILSSGRSLFQKVRSWLYEELFEFNTADILDLDAVLQ